MTTDTQEYVSFLQFQMIFIEWIHCEYFLRLEMMFVYWFVSRVSIFPFRTWIRVFRIIWDSFPNDLTYVAIRFRFELPSVGYLRLFFVDLLEFLLIGNFIQRDEYYRYKICYYKRWVHWFSPRKNVAIYCAILAIQQVVYLFMLLFFRFVKFSQLYFYT